MIGRGIERTNIFRTDVDRRDLVDIWRTPGSRIVKGEGIEESDLRSGIRTRKLRRTRRIFCKLAVGKMGYPGAEVGRYLGITTSSVNRLVVSEALNDVPGNGP